MSNELERMWKEVVVV